MTQHQVAILQLLWATAPKCTWLCGQTERSYEPPQPPDAAMSHRFKRFIIDDAVAHNVDPTLEANLLDLFESAVNAMAITLVREARYHTNDFSTAKVRNCEGFVFWLRQMHPGGSRDVWLGTFERDAQCLDVAGHLE